MEHISLAVLMGFALSLLATLTCVLWGCLRWNRVGGPDEPVEAITTWAAGEESKPK